jgi:hypothetical protein
MIAAGRSLPGGDDPRLRWICGAIESIAVEPPYALIVAAASLHWMDWEIVLPRFAAWLNENGYLALVEEIISANPWGTEIRPVLGQHSMNGDFQPYTMRTISQELERRGLFREAGALNTAPMLFRQPLGEWVESFHARNGFSRDRMDPHAAAECDRKLAEIVARYCESGIVEQRVIGRVIWGTPGSGSARR